MTTEFNTFMYRGCSIFIKKVSNPGLNIVRRVAQFNISELYKIPIRGKRFVKIKIMCYNITLANLPENCEVAFKAKRLQFI